MIRKKVGPIEYLQFELFQEIPLLQHAVFLRHGGVSQGPYATLNAGGGSGDSKEAVQTNRQTMQTLLGLKVMISLKQVHGTHIASIENLPYPQEEADGLITSQNGVGLMIKHADCQAAIFYDPTKHVLANVHCGWRGNVQNIYSHTITKLKNQYGCRPENILVAISPSLGPDHAEFIHYEKELPESFWGYQWKPHYFDLWAISKDQLLETGVLSDHIQFAEICTYENQDDCFSYRREKVTGRHGTIAALC